MVIPSVHVCSLEMCVIFGDPTILHNEQYSYIGDPMISANEQVKMWGSKVFILDNIEFALFDGINVLRKKVPEYVSVCSSVIRS